MSTMSKTCLGTVFWLFDVKDKEGVLFLLISLTVEGLFLLPLLCPLLEDCE